MLFFSKWLFIFELIFRLVKKRNHDTDKKLHFPLYHGLHDYFSYFKKFFLKLY